MTGSNASAFSAETAMQLGRALSRTGILGFTSEILTPEGDPRFHLYGASTGNLAAVIDGVSRSTGGASTRGMIDGADGSVRQDEARLLSIAEGIEQYLSCAYDDRQFIWATADEFGNEVMDVAQCCW